MSRFNFSPSQIIYSYTPRLSGISTVMISQFTSKTPTEISNELSNTADLDFNPYLTLISSGKNNNTFYQNQILDLQPNSKNWDIVSTHNSFYQRNVFAKVEPFWVYAIESNISFNKLYESQKILSNIGFLPFIKYIYICGSAALEQSSIYSDLDLIIVSKSVFGISTVPMCRFWLKLYLKINNRDVHPFFTHYLWIFTLKFGLKKWSQKLQHTFNKYKQSSRLRFDVGLIVDQSVDLNNYTAKDIDRLWFLARKKVVFDRDLPQIDYQNNIYLNTFKYKLSFFRAFVGFLIELFSWIVYPIFLVQYLWFDLFNKHDINQFASFKIWHSFTKVGFKKDKVVKLPDQKVYLNQ